MASKKQSVSKKLQPTVTYEKKKIIAAVPNTTGLGDLLFQNPSLAQLADYFKYIGEKHPEYSALTLGHEFYGYDGGVSIFVQGERLETDFEQSNRIRIEEAELKRWNNQQAEKLKKDKAEFDRLKKLFGEKT